MAALLEGGNRALGVMEAQLARTPFLVGDAMTVADIALYAYTHDAHVGGYDLGLGERRGGQRRKGGDRDGKGRETGELHISLP